jgi:hypothetical protein
MRSLVRFSVAALLAVGIATLPSAAPSVAPGGPRAEAATVTMPPVRHVFMIIYENKGFDATWGPDSQAPFLARTLRSKGVLAKQYYGTGHASLDNYISMISGQGPNAQTQGDCQIFTDFVRVGTVDPQQAVGSGCVYPADVMTVADQLEAAGRTWRGYMQQMGTPCRHPEIAAQDDTQAAEAGDMYATRHNPFMYFHSIIDDDASCRRHVVDLKQLRTDLQKVSTTRNLTFITPDLCRDGHDAPCVDGKPGGLVSFNAFVKYWAPRIMNSPAFKKDGLLIITADEDDFGVGETSSCCGEGPGPNAPLPGLFGMGGGRIGALLIAPRWIRPGTKSIQPYNHYSWLRSIEDIFGLDHLGYASIPEQSSFGPDIFNRN